MAFDNWYTRFRKHQLLDEEEKWIEIANSESVLKMCFDGLKRYSVERKKSKKLSQGAWEFYVWNLATWSVKGWYEVLGKLKHRN